MLQTVFLQRFYNAMVISNLKKTAEAIISRESQEELLSAVDEAAAKNALLIFLTDDHGNVLYNADEYSTLYGRREETSTNDGNSENPYFSEKETMNWQYGALRNLPNKYASFTEELLNSEDTHMGMLIGENDYIYGQKLIGSKAFSGETVILYLGTSLGAVEGTAQILRLQLVWVSLLALLLGLFFALWISRRFEKPIHMLAGQAEDIARGNEYVPFEKGFCRELDGLADSLREMADSLEQLENSRRELLANISHDLRTPLTMIKGYAEMVQEISWSDEEKRNTDLSIIQREADRLTALVNEILEYTSMQANQKEISMERVEISKTVLEVLNQFEPLCRENGYVMETDIASGLSVWGNRAALMRIIYNLIDNAVNHSGDCRKIRAALFETENRRIHFEVQDYGSGIEEKDIPYIWERYYTSRNRKNKETVSGLGLSIAKELLVSHHAEFGVKSENGCIVWFELQPAPQKDLPQPESKV
ncbi:MAG: HAMP domain-containing sensor histidine kinase [Eubacteriales bacterium]|nr:HAMP domain-containing sensor histidine kinase [Eubacteriales bacterium]